MKMSEYWSDRRIILHDKEKNLENTVIVNNDVEITVKMCYRANISVINARSCWFIVKGGSV